MEKDENNKPIYSIGIFGLLNSGKCTLSVSLSCKYGSISKPNWFIYKNIGYKILSIPCAYVDYNENFELSILNCDYSIVMVDTSVDLNNYDYYEKLIPLFFVNNVSKVIFGLNKIDKIKWSEENKKEFTKKINDIFDVYRTFFGKSTIEIDFIELNAKESINIDTIIEKIDNHQKENLNNENVKMQIFEHYVDQSQNTVVISGKIIEGNVHINNKEPTRLKYTFLPSNDAITLSPIKICNSEDQYVNYANAGEFITLKFDLQLFIPQTINKSSLLLSCDAVEQKDFAIFDTFEASIIAAPSSSCPVISKGLSCIFNSYSFSSESQIEKIVGTIEKDGSITKKPFIQCQTGVSGIIIIKIKEPIMRQKYELSNKLGTFTLKKGEDVIACGKINKYKKYIFK